VIHLTDDIKSNNHRNDKKYGEADNEAEFSDVLKPHTDFFIGLTD
jgi:hypothetical protein